MVDFARVESFHGELTVPDDWDDWDSEDQWQWLNDKMSSKHRWVEVEDFDYTDVPTVP